MAATGIGLAAGLGGGALLLAIAGIWGINEASKARSASWLTRRGIPSASSCKRVTADSPNTGSLRPALRIALSMK